MAAEFTKITINIYYDFSGTGRQFLIKGILERRLDVLNNTCCINSRYVPVACTSLMEVICEGISLILKTKRIFTSNTFASECMICLEKREGFLRHKQIVTPLLR